MYPLYVTAEKLPMMGRDFLLLLTLASVAGCGSTNPNPSKNEASMPTSVEARPRNPKIPIEVSYPIIEDEEEYSPLNKKRMVKVKLNQRVSEDVLREIALEVKATERRQYERTFVFYYLPEPVPEIKADPWATSHFNPTLSVDIMGLTVEQEKELRGLPLSHAGGRIGAWLIDAQLVSRIVLLYEEDGTIRMATITGPGEPFVQDMQELPTENGRRFKLPISTEVYEVGERGMLRLRNAKGEVIQAALPLDGTH